MNAIKPIFDASDEGLAKLMGEPVAKIRSARRHLEFVRAVGRRIKLARESKGMTQDQLGEKLGVTKGRVSQYESGELRHAPNLATLIEIAEWLEKEPEWFFGLNERPAISLGKAKGRAITTEKPDPDEVLAPRMVRHRGTVIGLHEAKNRDVQEVVERFFAKPADEHLMFRLSETRKKIEMAIINKKKNQLNEYTVEIEKGDEKFEFVKESKFIEAISMPVAHHISFFSAAFIKMFSGK